MSDLISREKLKDDIAVLLERNGKLIDEWLADCIDDVIDEQPTVDVVPVKHGRWKRNKYYPHIIFCDECGEPYEISNSMEHWNYCPNCGAKMEVKM